MTVIITSLQDLPGPTKPALTIGFFDGVHLGHQALFAKLCTLRGSPFALTFASHPLQTLNPSAAPLLITPLPIKLSLLRAQGLNTIAVLPFSNEFARLTFEELLSRFTPSSLLLGKGSVFGKNREGTEETVRAWAKSAAIHAEYLEKLEIEGAPVSSCRIRDAIQAGDLSLAEKLLGRPHLLYIPARTTEVSVSHLCLPPDGKYTTTLMDSSLKKKSQKCPVRLSTQSDERRVTIDSPFPSPTILAFGASHV